MIGYPVLFQTGTTSFGQGTVSAYDPETDMVTVIDEDDGSVWRGSAEKIEHCEDVCFFDKSTGYPYSAAVRNAAGEWVSGKPGKTLQDWQIERPEMVLLTWRKAEELMDRRARCAPELITKAQFWEALECLPPCGWYRGGFTESFKMSERISGQITRIYVRLGSDYFSFADRISMTHAEAVRIVEAAAPALLATSAAPAL